MDLNLHQKQGINHLKRVLDYAPFVQQNGEATVHLTGEDWQVLADTLFAMQTPKSLLPEQIEEYRLSDNRTIDLAIPGLLVHVDVI